MRPKSRNATAPAFRAVIDVGHSVESPGAFSARGVAEYEFNLRLAKLIEQKLVEAGFAKTVLLDHVGQGEPSLVKRVAAANALPADLFVSIHHDLVPQMFKEKWALAGQ